MAISECELSEIIDYNREAAQRITPVFQDRAEAGVLLADDVHRRRFVHPVVIAIVHGGVPVALPFAERAEVPLHLFFAAKIPFSAADHRFGIGATTAAGTTILNRSFLQQFDVSEQTISYGIRLAQQVIARNRAELAPLFPPLPSDLHGRTAIIVDDGVASGLTVSAVIADLRLLSPDRIVVATAVLSPQGRAALAAQRVEFVASYQAPGPEFLLDNFFAHFGQLVPQDVKQLVQKPWLPHPRSGDLI